MEVSLRCHNSPRRNRVRVTSHTGSAWRFVWEFEKRDSWVLDAKRKGSTFGAHRRKVNVRPMGGPLEMGAKWIRLHRRLCLSSLRQNLSLKVNKKVSYLNKKSLCVFEFRDSYVLYIFYSYQHSMSISPILHCTWPYSCIWLCNKIIAYSQWEDTSSEILVVTCHSASTQLTGPV